MRPWKRPKLFYSKYLLILFSVSHGVVANEVRVYNWSDYIAQAVIEEFESETGIKVIYDVYDSNEVLEGKLLAGNTGYDIVGPSIEYLGRQIVAGIFQDLNKSKLTNYQHLDQEILKLLSIMDPGNTAAIPYLWGTTGIGYNKNKAKEIMGDDFQINTFDVIFDPEIVSKFAQCGVAFLDAPSEVFKAALFYLGLDPNTKNPKDFQGPAFDLLIGVRPFIRYFHSSKYINDLANGEICLVFGWNGRAYNGILFSNPLGWIVSNINSNFALFKDNGVRYITKVLLAIRPDSIAVSYTHLTLPTTPYV